MPLKIEIYQTAVSLRLGRVTLKTKKEWRWRVRSRNGRIVATSGAETYKRRGAMLRILGKLFPHLAAPEVVKP